MPIELTSARVNSDVLKMPRVVVPGPFLGQNEPSVIVDGSLNDSDTIQSTGMSASTMTTMLAVLQPTFCLRW